MSRRVGRSIEPLYQTRGRPVRWVVTLSLPSGMSWDLTGSTITSALAWKGASQALTVTDAGSDGKIVLTADASASAAIPVGVNASLHLSLVDAAGEVFDFVWPVIGELP